MTQLTLHFSLEELTLSGAAMRRGIDNTPDERALKNLREVLAPGLELVRAKLLMPMHIDSGFRCWALNRLVGGSETSGHPLGLCADFICPRFGSPFHVASELAHRGIRFDQLILEYGWVHISFDPRMRGEVLTKKSRSAPYLDGLVP